MALYKPKNLKPSIINGPVNMDITKGGEFSFQIDGNEPIEKYNLIIDEKIYSVNDTMFYADYYMDLETVDMTSIYVEPFTDIFRKEYPIFDATVNKDNEFIFNKLPEDFTVSSIELDSIYYQHEYRNAFSSWAGGHRWTVNQDIILPESCRNKVQRLYVVDWDAYWLDTRDFPIIKEADIYKEMVRQKRVYSNVQLPLSYIKTSNSVKINSKQLYNSLQNSIAKNHFMKISPFDRSTFGCFNWMFVKFKITVKVDNEDFKDGKDIYYIKGFIPRTNDLNPINFNASYFANDYAYGTVELTNPPSEKVIIDLGNTDEHWKEEPRRNIVSAFGSYYNIVSFNNTDYFPDTICQKHPCYNENYKKFFNILSDKNSVTYYLKNWDASLTITNQEIIVPSAEPIDIDLSLSKIQHLYLNQEETEININQQASVEYPLDANGNNRTFKFTLKPEDSGDPLFNNFQFPYKREWNVNVESNYSKVSSVKENVLYIPDFFININLGEMVDNQYKIKGCKDIPVNITFDYPDMHNLIYSFKENTVGHLMTNPLKKEDGQTDLWTRQSVYMYPKFYYTEDGNNFIEGEKRGYDKYVKISPFSYKENFVVLNSTGNVMSSINADKSYIYIKLSFFCDILNEKLSSSNTAFQDFLKKYLTKENIVIYISDKNNKLGLISDFALNDDIGGDDKGWSWKEYFDYTNIIDSWNDCYLSATKGNDVYSFGFQLTNIEYKDNETVSTKNIISELNEIKSVSYKIIDEQSKKIIKETSPIYTGDLNYKIDFLRPGNYSIEVILENIFGMKQTQKQFFEIPMNSEDKFIKKPALNTLLDSGVYLNWQDIMFLYAYYSDGTYPKGFLSGDEIMYYFGFPTLKIPEEKSFILNLAEKECNYIAYCFQPIDQKFGEEVSRKVARIESQKYWYDFFTCMIDSNNTNNEYKYTLNIKVLNNELEQLSPTDSENVLDQVSIEFTTSDNIEDSSSLYYILLLDNKERKIYFKIFSRNSELDYSFEEVITKTNFIDIPVSSNWNNIFTPANIELFNNQYCNYIFGTNGNQDENGNLLALSIDKLDLSSAKIYSAKNDIFSFNPIKSDEAYIIAENKTKDEIADVTVVRVDKTNNTSKIVLDQNSFTNNFIDYSAPSKTDCYYEIYLGNNFDQPYTTDIINTGDPGKWFLLVCDDVWDENGLNESKVTVSDIYEFEANITVGQMSNNTDFSVSKNFTRYPKVQHSPSCYWSGTLGGLLGVINKAGTKYTQTTEMLNKFKQLTIDDRRKFLKDRDGNIWEVSLSAANTVATETKLSNQLKTANISWVEVADTAPTMIYLDDINDATWLQEETVLETSSYNGRTQF